MKRRELTLSAILVICLSTGIALAGTTTSTYYFDTPRVEVINGETVVILDGASTWGKVGEPMLPHMPVKLLLPPGEEAISITIETSDPVIVGDGYRISPMQQQFPLSQGPVAEPTKPKAAVYGSDNPYPAELFDDLQTQFLSGYGIALAVVYPVTYQPASGRLSYFPWMKVTVLSQPTPGAQATYDQMLKSSKSVRDRVANLVQNPEAISIYGQQTPTRPETWELLLITPSDFVAGYQEFIDYKNRSGIRTGVLTTEEIFDVYAGVDNQEKVRNAIIDYYTSYNVRYVFLCGDNEHIPARSLWCIDDNLPSDLYYACLDGNWNDDGDAFWGEPGEEDLIAEVFVGRSCADNPDEISHVVNKNLMYQTNPVVAEVETALMAGEDLGWASWAWEYKEEVRLGSSNWGYTTTGFPANFDVGTLYEYPGQYWSAMGNLLPLLNEGPTLVNHLGHANWDYVMKFSRGQINDVNFTNDGIENNFFIGYSQGCICGDFAHFVVDCILEEFTTISHGAVAFLGNSRYGWGSYNNTNGASQRFDREFFDAIFGENVTTIAAANHDSKEDNAWLVPSDDIIRWTYYCLNLFGDPTLDVWTAQPGNFYPDYNPVVLQGAQVFEVRDISTPGALVTISMDNEVLGQGIAAASGIATVTFNQPVTQMGTLDLVITAHDMLPYQGTVLAIPSSGPYVILSECIIEDGTTGNGNGQLDYGETVGFTVSVENVGVDNASGVNLILSCDDPLITLIDAEEYLAGINSGATCTLNDAFALEVSSDVLDGAEISFELTASDGDSTWVSPFSITAHAPEFIYGSILIDDPAGNGDNHFDPGETADFNITIENAGSSDATGISVLLSSTEPLIIIPSDSIYQSSLTAGEEIVLFYPNVSANPDLPQGDSVAFALSINDECGYSCVLEFVIPVGDVRYDPVGPDGYGYFAYDPYDGADAPEYDWIEIAPLAGGPGTDLQLGDDQAVPVPLPFSFRYYGVDFTEISVCSHGWVCMGAIEGIFFPLNICIPHIVPPNNTIAAFWDELSPTAGGQVCYLFDESNHRFVVEWYQVPHELYPDDPETFQVILYDPAYQSTPTGDGEILVNYHTLSDQLNGCALGIEDSSGTTGLQYLHNGSYAESAMPLETPFAIKYTTAGSVVAVESPESKTLPKSFALDQNYPNPFNPATTLRFSLPKTANVKLVVYDLQGRQVAVLVDGQRPAGVHEVVWEAAGLASGLYFYRIQAGDYIATKKMMLIK